MKVKRYLYLILLLLGLTLAACSRGTHMDVISQPLSDTQDLLDLNRNLQSEIYAIHAENQ